MSGADVPRPAADAPDPGHSPVADRRPHAACGYPWQQVIIDLTGEVVPCCFWSGYANSGRPLGNTNEASLDEIWNGAAWRELRRRNASGDVAGTPCHECLAWKWGGGTYPKFELPTEVRREQGHAWLAPLPEGLRSAGTAPEGEARPRLLEDGRELGPADALHDDIRREGGGRYSVWNGWLYFSPSDNGDPTCNGRRYELVAGERIFPVATLAAGTPSGRNLLLARDEHARGAEVMAAKPSMISFIGSADCNIDCPACSQNTVRRVKVQHRPGTESEVLAHVPFLQQFIWHGGEPWLIARFREFVDGFRPEDNPHLAFGFTTNGTLLDAKELAKLEKFPRVNASISVDSFRKQSFEAIRKGARFETVRDNVLRAVAWSDPPRRVVSVGMVVLKSNVLELADNLEYAIAHDIGLNLSPVVVYPVTERLDVFEDFAVQARGWDLALERAFDVVREAKAAGRTAMRRVDPEGMLVALGDIFSAARRRHERLFEVGFVVSDPHGSLARMRRPGVIASVSGRVIAYARLNGAASAVGHGARGAVRRLALRLPLQDLSGPEGVKWTFCHDLLEPMGIVERDELRDSRGRPASASGWRDLPREVRLELPPFAPVALPRNASLSHAGRPTPNGLRVTDPQQVFSAYQALVAAEAARGIGVQGTGALPLGERLRRQAAAALSFGRYHDFGDPHAAAGGG